jgi:hypothetical protein
MQVHRSLQSKRHPELATFSEGVPWYPCLQTQRPFKTSALTSIHLTQSELTSAFESLQESQVDPPQLHLSGHPTTHPEFPLISEGLPLNPCLQTQRPLITSAFISLQVSQTRLMHPIQASLQLKTHPGTLESLEGVPTYPVLQMHSKLLFNSAFKSLHPLHEFVSFTRVFGQGWHPGTFKEFEGSPTASDPQMHSPKLFTTASASMHTEHLLFKQSLHKDEHSKWQPAVDALNDGVPIMPALQMQVDPDISAFGSKHAKQFDEESQLEHSTEHK